VMDPNEARWGDLSGGEKGARLAGGAAKGALQGFGNYANENQALRQPNAPAMNPMQFAPQTPQIFGQKRADPFYG
jgi:hypothetical protein